MTIPVLLFQDDSSVSSDLGSCLEIFCRWNVFERTPWSSDVALCLLFWLPNEV